MKAKKSPEANRPAMIFDEDMGGHYDSGTYSMQAAHPGYFWVSTDAGLEDGIQMLRTIAREY